MKLSEIICIMAGIVWLSDLLTGCHNFAMWIIGAGFYALAVFIQKTEK